MTKKTHSFEDWFKELKRIAVAEFDFSPEAAESMDEGAYKEFGYDVGDTPMETMTEELLNM